MGVTCRHRESEMERRLIRIKEVCEITGFGRSTIYKKMNLRLFPLGIVRFRRHLWWLHEILEFMGAKQAAARTTKSRDTAKPRRVKLAIHRKQAKTSLGRA